MSFVELPKLLNALTKWKPRPKDTTVNLSKKDSSEHILILFVVSQVVMMVQLIGALWLYSKFTGTEVLSAEVPIAIYCICAAWTVVAIYVFLHDLVLCYALINRADMPDKIYVHKRMSEEQVSLFFLTGIIFMVLSIPAVLYREKKGL